MRYFDVQGDRKHAGDGQQRETHLDGGLEKIRMGEEVHLATEELRAFLFENVYENKATHVEFMKASKVLTDLFNHFMNNPGPFDKPGLEASEYRGRLVCDFIAGMTDRYVLKLYEELFIPRPWDKL